MSKKTAVVMFNLGGPDCLDAVKPFLFNLFYDPAIITVPNPLRWIIAKSISRKRAPIARDIYRKIGNKSPILEETEKQRAALEISLNGKSENTYKCFIFMRYWHPFASEITGDVKSFDPDEIILLPLYPQYSVTTTATGIINWNDAAKKENLTMPYKVIKDYPDADFFIDTIIDMIKEKTANITEKKEYRLLLSAHGLPKKIIEAGDLYQKHVEKTCAAIMKNIDSLDYVICYQSRVGPLEWIGPSTDDEIKRAGRDHKNIIMVPVAFISEHSETLVELDIEYKELAKENAVADYIRIDTVGHRSKFIEGLANMVLAK